MSWNIVKPNDRVRLTPLDDKGPVIEGFVKDADSVAYVTIQGCGFTQFQSAQYAIEIIEPVPSAQPVDVLEAAKETLIKLLDSYDEGIRLGAAKELVHLGSPFSPF